MKDVLVLNSIFILGFILWPSKLSTISQIEGQKRDKKSPELIIENRLVDVLKN